MPNLKQMNNMRVALFKETYVSPRPIKLSKVIALMKDSSKAKSILAARKYLQEDKSGNSLPESKLPPMILFNHQPYNGIVLLEINNLAVSEIKSMRSKASESPQTLAVFTGLDGKSMNLLVQFTYSDGELPETKDDIELFHAHAYRKAVNYYSMQLEREVMLLSAKSKSVCRLSYDPDLYYNLDAVAITMEQPFNMPEDDVLKKAIAKESDLIDRLIPGAERSRIISLLYETSLRDSIDYFGGVSPDDPKLFLTRLAENCRNSGIPEEDAIRWSAFHSELKEHEMEFRATIRNVYLLKDKFGKKLCINPSQQLALQLGDFMQRRYELRRNEIKREVEFRNRASYHFGFRPVTDEVLNTFSIDAHTEGYSFWDRDVKRYVYSERIPLHNPVDSFLEDLPKWDGKDHIRKLAKTIPTSNTRWPDYFYRWFLGMVAQWKQMNKTYANSVVPLLVGDQGCGKSTWCRNLIPQELREYYTDSLDFGSKRDAEMALCRFLLINLDEFDSIGSAYQPFLKHLLQKPQVNARKPHKSNIQLMKRYGVFIATSNNPDLLSDPTGSRRFIGIEIKGLIQQPEKINYGQLYAQALHTLKNKERYWFNKQEEQTIVNGNTVFEQKAIEEQLFLRYFNIPENEDEGEWLAAIEIIERLQRLSKMKFGAVHVRQFGRILKKNNIQLKHTYKGNMYHVKQVE